MRPHSKSIKFSPVAQPRTCASNFGVIRNGCHPLPTERKRTMSSASFTVQTKILRACALDRPGPVCHQQEMCAQSHNQRASCARWRVDQASSQMIPNRYRGVPSLQFPSPPRAGMKETTYPFFWRVIHAMRPNTFDSKSFTLSFDIEEMPAVRNSRET